MAVIYSLTTPIGVALGIAIHSAYDENSQAALITQGTLDAVSAGILIYDALVNLITVNITHSQFFASLSRTRQIGVFLALWTGAGMMALLGLWV